MPPAVELRQRRGWGAARRDTADMKKVQVMCATSKVVQEAMCNELLSREKP